MKMTTKKFLFLVSILFVVSCEQKPKNENTFQADAMLIRISEIETAPAQLEKYISILKEEASESVKLEPGVIAIFPMYHKENPTKIKILEIYRNYAAYESHLQTSHFKHYKSSTLDMVKSLKLIDMKAIDGETMPEIFEKLANND